MTSSERKIINFLGRTKEKTNIRLIAQKTNLSSDYARLLCRALARSGHIKFENDLCHLLKRGRSRFENNDPAIEEPAAVVANVTLLTDEPVVASPASDRNDEEENQEEDANEDKDEGKSADSDEELDKALADLGPSSNRSGDDSPSAEKDEEEEQDKPGEQDEKTEELADESKEEMKTEPVEEVRAETDAEEKEKMGNLGEIKSEPEPKEPEKTTPEAEAKSADNPAPTTPSENPPVVSIVEPEKAAPKEEPAKPAGSFRLSFKKVVSWFIEKK